MPRETTWFSGLSKRHLALLPAALLTTGLAGCGGSSSSADTTPPPETIDPDTPSQPQLPAGIEMIAIPGGEFTMGGDTIQGDAPVTTVTLSDFTIAATEVTNAQYIEFLNQAWAEGWVTVELTNTADPCGNYEENMVIATDVAPYPGETYLQLGETGGCTSHGEPEHIDNKSWITFSETDGFTLLEQDKADWPVNWIKWYGAAAFAEFYGVSLPTEAQWEYAAKGGYNQDYATFDGLLDSTKANYNGDEPGVYNPDGHSVAVMSYLPNPYGLYDMSGNAWEWCQDFYAADFYADGAEDPLNNTSTSEVKRVRRGGSWNYHANTLLSYARAADFENRGNNHFGFRIVSL